MFFTMEYKKGFFITIASSRNGDTFRVIQDAPRNFYDCKTLLGAKRLITKLTQAA